MDDQEILTRRPIFEKSGLRTWTGMDSIDGLILSRVDGKTTVQQIVSLTGMGREKTINSVRKLMKAGILRFEGIPSPGAETIATPPGAAPAPPEPPPRSTTPPERVRVDARTPPAPPAEARARHEPRPSEPSAAEIPEVSIADLEPIEIEPPEWVKSALQTRERPAAEAAPIASPEQAPPAAFDSRGGPPQPQSASGPSPGPGLEEPRPAPGPVAPEPAGPQAEDRWSPEPPRPERMAPPSTAEPEAQARQAAPDEEGGWEEAPGPASAFPAGWRVEGDLSKDPVHRVAVSLFNEKHTGVLRIEHGSDWKEVYFYRGHPNCVEEPSPKFPFGETLRKTGLLSAEDLANAKQLSAEEGKKLGLILGELGCLTEFQLRGLLRSMVEMRLSEIFAWEKGKYSFLEDPRERSDMLLVQIDMPKLLFAGLKSKYPYDKARLELEPNMDRYLRKNPDMAKAIAKLKLSPAEKRFVDVVLDGTRTLRQTLGLSTLKTSATLQIVNALVVTGMVSFESKAIQSVQIEHLGVELTKKWRQIRSANHFDVLEVHWTCLQGEIDKAYQRVKEEYDPASPRLMGNEDLVKKATAITEKIREAYEAIRDGEARSQYRVQVIPPDKLLFAADFNYQQGKSAKFVGNHALAKEYFLRAHELAPTRYRPSG